MVRAQLYLAAAAVVLASEGVLFSHFLHFAGWQIALLLVFYVALFAVTLRAFRRAAAEVTGPVEDLTVWRLISVAPMAALIVGSFVSLPLLLGIAALGKVL